MAAVCCVLVLLKAVLYIFLSLVVFVIGLKLWLEPFKGTCRCKTRLDNKVALVTGANSGIGLETARDLAKRGARVIIASRDEEKSKKAVEDIKSTTGNKNVEYGHLDLSKFQSVRAFAEDFNNTVDRLDILVNNAGCAGLKKQTTEDGIDIVMQINYLGPFLLTTLLMEKLIASKPSRIVIVSSYGHFFTWFDPEDLRGLNTLGYWFRYANSKLCNVLWARALSNRLPRGVTVNSLHPGVVKTNIFNNLQPVVKKILLTVIDAFFKSPEEGAMTSVHVCVSPELEGVSGEYFSDCKLGAMSRKARDDDLAEKVWNYSVQLIKAK